MLMSERASQPSVPSTLFHGGRIYSPTGPDATALLVRGAQIAWIGGTDAAAGLRDAADDQVDLNGALLTPAFVDAHVHATSTGLALTGLDLHAATSATDVLDRVARHVGDVHAPVVLGSGWDDSAWTDPRRPTADELDRAGGGRPVYLSRVDAHSALASAALLALSEDVSTHAGFRADGWLSLDAHHTARQTALRLLPIGQRRAAQSAFLRAAAALGVGSVHEMAGPEISSAGDLGDLLTLAGAQGPGDLVEVVGYWGELDGVDAAIDLGAAGAAGDLFCDGALGSHTAALHEAYHDRPGERGWLRFDAEQVARHVAACTEAGIQAGFHAIGDAAVDVVLDGVERAATRLGPAVTSAGHRLEHAEMVADPRRLAASGLVASVQPAFDAAWGGGRGMYAGRLGADRAAALNGFAAASAAGVVLALGSDCPVTPLDPWGAVRAAAYPHERGAALSVRAAFAAHTRGGWRAARRDGDGSGVLAVGHPATFAVWAAGELAVDGPDERVSRWSTDPRAAVAGLPDVAPGRALAQCLRTVVRGRTVFDADTSAT